MNDVHSLLSKIDAEFDAAKQRIAEFQQQKLDEYQARQQRLEQFSQTCDTLREVWGPRLDALAERFGDRASVTPNVTPSLREARFHFQSQLARIELSFSAMPDTDVHNLVVRYDLKVLPILMQFKNSDTLSLPLDKVDPKVVADWIDDRIIDFVKTYLAIHENQHYMNYLKEYMVEDPIAGVRFPKYAAATSCEFDGKTYYFIGEPTCQEFRQQHGIS